MSRTITLAGYAMAALLLAGLQVASVASRRFPSIGQAAAVVTRRRAGRYLVLAGWLWLGWHLFVRSSAGA